MTVSLRLATSIRCLGYEPLVVASEDVAELVMAGSQTPIDADTVLQLPIFLGRTLRR